MGLFDNKERKKSRDGYASVDVLAGDISLPNSRRAILDMYVKLEEWKKIDHPDAKNLVEDMEIYIADRVTQYYRRRQDSALYVKKRYED